jgi:hypothetical protein
MTKWEVEIMGTHETACNKSCTDYPATRISVHASDRMHGRSITFQQIDMVIRFGRVAHVRGATVYAIGRREMEQLLRLNINTDRLEGLQVVCDPWSGTVITAYRNRDLSSLRRKSRYYGKLRRHGSQELLAA